MSPSIPVAWHSYYVGPTSPTKTKRPQKSGNGEKPEDRKTTSRSRKMPEPSRSARQDGLRGELVAEPEPTMNGRSVRRRQGPAHDGGMIRASDSTGAGGSRKLSILFILKPVEAVPVFHALALERRPTIQGAGAHVGAPKKGLACLNGLGPAG